MNCGVKAETHHLDELAVLHHHGVDDAEERLVRGEETGTASESVALEHALAGVLRQDLNDTTTLGTGSDIPLEVAGGVAEGSVELVGDELIGGEDAEGLGVPEAQKISATSKRNWREKTDSLMTPLRNSPMVSMQEDSVPFSTA